MTFDTNRVEEFTQQYEQMNNAARYVVDVSDTSLFDLFTDDFMKEYTKFGSRDEFFDYGGWDVQTEEDLPTLPQEDFEEYVRTYTVFDTSEEMLDRAGMEWVVQTLGFS